MTEFSYWWTTSGTPAGDQVASYTQAHLARISAVLAACSGFEGIAPGYLNQLAGTVTGANTVAINTGGAVVDGKAYTNDASADVTIPSASGGGNTRIDRIVLRAGWAGFTARLTRIAGTDAASPSAPAITQTSGTTYDVTLYRALVNTSGAVTLTDERVFASGNSNSLGSGVVTLAKMAANSVDSDQYVDGSIDNAHLAANSVDSDQYVDGSIDNAHLAANSVDSDQYVDGSIDNAHLAANSVDSDQYVDGSIEYAHLATGAVISNRQGGSATEWGGASGGNTNYDTAGAKIQVGAKLTGAGASGSGSVTFPAAFAQKPLIFIQPGVEGQTIDITAVTASGFDFDFTDPLPAAIVFYWQAIGPG